jgi:hypothetical protein
VLRLVITARAVTSNFCKTMKHVARRRSSADVRQRDSAAEKRSVIRVNLKEMDSRKC